MQNEQRCPLLLDLQASIPVDRGAGFIPPIWLPSSQPDPIWVAFFSSGMVGHKLN